MTRIRIDDEEVNIDQSEEIMIINNMNDYRKEML
jgi:hypothetical protein